MTTATGDFAINFAALANTNPLTNANMTYLDAGRLAVTSGKTKCATNGVGALWRYSGTLSGGTLRSKVEVGTASALGDVIFALLLDAAGNGYALQISGVNLSLKLFTALSISGLVGGTAASAASGDVFQLEKIGTTLNVIHNGSTLFSTTDATYSSNLAPGIGFDSGNNNLSDAISWAGDGVSVGGSPYSMTATQGSFALTGQTAGVSAQRKVAAVQGSYTLSGQDANVVKSGTAYSVTADVGLYTLIGSDAQRDITMTADQGSYAMTGQNATTAFGRILAAAQGLYSLAGSVINMIYSGAPALFGGSAFVFTRRRRRR